MTGTLLATNIKELMKANESLGTQDALGKASGIDQRTVGRIINGTNSPRLKQVEAIAGAFGLLPWQLLIPALDPKNPPVCELTRVEKELYEKLRRLVKQLPSE